MTDKYNEILYEEYSGSKNHRKMLNSARAAQFMPFAALTGYSEAIQDASITTDQKKDFLLSFQEMSITETAGAAAWHSTHEARCH